MRMRKMQEKDMRASRIDSVISGHIERDLYLSESAVECFFFLFCQVTKPVLINSYIELD